MDACLGNVLVEGGFSRQEEASKELSKDEWDLYIAHVLSRKLTSV